VLSDEMTAFLFTLGFELYVDERKQASKSDRAYSVWEKRCHARVDDCRHFSRLPHRVTWMEYSMAAQQEKRRELLPAIGQSSDYTAEELAEMKRANVRIGWLMRQHDHVETAFAAERFVGRSDISAIARDGFEILWCTDNAPLPWPDLLFTRGTPDGLAISEYLAGVGDYYRPNVGLRHSDIAQPVIDRIEGAEVSGCARELWCFLSTFNKVPIFDEHTVVRASGFVRDGYHKFLEHKVLTINVPQKAGLRAESPDRCWPAFAAAPTK
jgi:hypothetical protein